MLNTIIIAKTNFSKLARIWFLDNYFLSLIYPFLFLGFELKVLFFIIPFHLYQFYKMIGQFFIRFELLKDSFVIGDFKYNYDEIESIALNRQFKSNYISPIKFEIEGISIKTTDEHIHELPVSHYSNQNEIMALLEQLSINIEYGNYFIENMEPISNLILIKNKNEINFDNFEQEHESPITVVELIKSHEVEYVFGGIGIILYIAISIEQKCFSIFTLLKILLCFVGFIILHSTYYYFYINYFDKKRFMYYSKTDLLIEKSNNIHFIPFEKINETEIMYLSKSKNFLFVIKYTDFSKSEFLINNSKLNSLMNILKRMNVYLYVNS